MTARKKHIRTSYEGKRKEHRAAASRHVLVLEAQINEMISVSCFMLRMI